MRPFADDEARLLSRPVTIRWAGWESTTTRLQQCGWEMAAEQRPDIQSVQLILRHPGFGLYGMTRPLDLDFFQAAGDMRYFEQIGFDLGNMSASMQFIPISTVDPANFTAIDAMPTMITGKRKSIEDFHIFAAPLVRTQELIVPEATVPELLEKIIKMQEPGRQEYFDERVRQMNHPHGVIGEGARPEHKFHAQILSLVA